jgi:hypothetical protein
MNGKTETCEEQIGRLATFIMNEIPGEPSRSEGAVDCAIRLLRKGDLLNDLVDHLAIILDGLRKQKETWGEKQDTEGLSAEAYAKDLSFLRNSRGL